MNNRHWTIILLTAVLLAQAAVLCSCSVLHQTFSKKAEVTFNANGGIVTGSGVETDGPSDPEVYTAKCIVGDELSGFTASKEYYIFTGWFTDKEGGRNVTKGPEKDAVLYAHWESANKDRSVTISDISAEAAGGHDDGSGPADLNLIRISEDEEDNVIKVSFTVSKWYGQKIAFVNKKGKRIKLIDVEESDFSDGPITVTCELPDRKWMDHKEYSYYIRSLKNDHVDASKAAELKIVLDGQYEDFDKPIEGSMVWYGGPDPAPEDRAGVILSTDDDHVYALSSGSIYKWKKEDVMINLADVRTDIVYDIYNAYSSRFFPIRGKAMYSDNGGRGLKRYDVISRDDAVHKNDKTGRTTFMVPVQWDFAETVASAQEKARGMGVTLYIVDSFRPMDSTGPVARAVDNYALLAAGGTSAHNFGLAVDTGWQTVDEKGKPVGDPFVKNLQVLNKKKAVKGPRGNDHELWWAGVNKLPQEWWHYGNNTLPGRFREHARRVGDLYVNLYDCTSMKRSKMHASAS